MHYKFIVRYSEMSLWVIVLTHVINHILQFWKFLYPKIFVFLIFVQIIFVILFNYENKKLFKLIYYEITRIYCKAFIRDSFRKSLSNSRIRITSKRYVYLFCSKLYLTTTYELFPLQALHFLQALWKWVCESACRACKYILTMNFGCCNKG